MTLPNIFAEEVGGQVIHRINHLSPTSTPKWGKMTVGQMLAHCCVSYEMIYEDIHPKPNGFMRFILKNLVKSKVVSGVPYKHNLRTAPQFLMKETKNFDVEKERLINYIKKTQESGINSFDGKESHSFGKLSNDEWNNMLYKHLDHHLSQFGV
ncbi:MAG: DUF1569 domain-containing protein [Ginsengibacter sp.]